MRNEIGKPLFLPPFKGRIHPSYNYPSFIREISDCHSLLRKPSCKILLEGRNRVGAVALPLAEGGTKDIVIKEFHTRGLNKLKSLLLPSKAFKAWRGGMALVERKIETPLPVAYFERRGPLFLEQSFFLSEMVKDIEEIRFLFIKLPPEELRELLKALALYLSHCHREGILHRDLSDGNILIKRDKAGKFLFYLIDTNRIRIKRRIGLLWRLKCLIRLGVPSQFQQFFLEQYLGSPHVNRFLWLWYKINKKKYSWFVEIKKVLRIKQLAQRLKIQ
ncbi:MAG: hypothetical protein E3J56_10790 [Candidatus Aminicenantes bacterium]|nr:MAG: hypothetical protein E3J56_10790 [Candidatus Aminicenantes bacterium]